MNKLIIHISGPSGSGKTFLGNKLKQHFKTKNKNKNKNKNKIVVKDLDILRDEQIKKTYDTTKRWCIDELKYQKFIDDFIKKQKKPIIFVGLNDNPLGSVKIYYNLYPTYKFYIDIDDKEVLQQKCLRMLTDEIPNDKFAMKDLVNDNNKFLKGIKYAIENSCNLQKLIK